MYPSYIPAPDADFAIWLANFSALIDATPTNYDLTAPQAAAVAGVALTWANAYPLSQDPATRTPVTIAAKDVARQSAEAIVRPIAVGISVNPGVTNALKTGVGVTVRSLVPTPIPAPSAAPSLAIVNAIPLVLRGAYAVADAVGKAKPFGSVGVELAVAIGVAHTVDPLAATARKIVTKSPYRLSFV